jgi:hypothetical protein
MGGGDWATGEEQNDDCWALEEEETESLRVCAGWEKKETNHFFNERQL